MLKMLLAGMVYVKVLASTTVTGKVPLYWDGVAPRMVTVSPVVKPCPLDVTVAVEPLR